jgi:cell division protein FtsB
MENYSATRKVERIVVSCLLALVAVFAVAIYSFVALGNARRKNAEYDELIASLEMQRTSLEQNVDKMQTDSYLEEQARNQFGMIKDGETLYIYD